MGWWISCRAERRDGRKWNDCVKAGMIWGSLCMGTTETLRERDRGRSEWGDWLTWRVHQRQECPICKLFTSSIFFFTASLALVTAVSLCLQTDHWSSCTISSWNSPHKKGLGHNQDIDNSDDSGGTGGACKLTVDKLPGTTHHDVATFIIWYCNSHFHT